MIEPELIARVIQNEMRRSRRDPESNRLRSLKWKTKQRNAADRRKRERAAAAEFAGNDAWKALDSPRRPRADAELETKSPVRGLPPVLPLLANGVRSRPPARQEFQSRNGREKTR